MSNAFTAVLDSPRKEPTPQYDSDGVQLYCGDAVDTLDVVDDVALTVTSPPYLDAIDYDEIDGDYTQRDGQAVDSWRTTIHPIFAALYDATIDGGYCAVVISDVSDQDGSYQPLTSHFAMLMESIGWNYHENITWAKPTGGSTRFGTLIQHPHPTYYYPNRQSEEIQIWVKGEDRTEKRDDHTIEITDVLKKEVANDVWHIPPVPHNRDDISHPCPFPTEIVDRLVRLYSYPGELVCDPMMGSGTTPYVASGLDRDSVGIEIRDEYVSGAVERVTTEYKRTDVVVPQYPTRDVT